MGRKETREKRLKQIVRQISGKVAGNDEPVPEVAIRGTGYIMCYNSSSRSFTRVARGTKAYIIDPQLNESKRVIIYTLSGDVVEIDPNELINTGFD
jgi:hypothetical protein